MSNSPEYINAYYVNPYDGSDNNEGSDEQPFKTIQHAVNRATANQNDSNKIYLQEGAYYLQKPIWINEGGASGFPLTISSAPGETAAIDGSQLSSGNIPINIKNVQNVKISDLIIRNSPSHGLEVVNGQHIKILNNEIYDTRSAGIRIRGHLAEVEGEENTKNRSSNIQIEDNRVHHTNLSNSGSNKGKGNWAAAIQVYNAEDVQIADNLVYKNYGEGIGLPVVRSGLVTNNVLYDNFSVQLYLDNASHFEVKDNFIYNTGNKDFYHNGYAAQGIALANEIYKIEDISNFRLNRHSIYNNIIVGGSIGIGYGTWAGRHNSESQNQGGWKNSIVTHNTVYDPDYETVNISDDSGISNVHFTNNIFYQKSSDASSKIDDLTGLNFRRNLWYEATSGDAESWDDVEEDPLFVNPGGYNIADYQLRYDSGAIDNAKWTEWNSNDLVDGSPDLGALEYGEAPFVAGIDR